MPGRSSNSTPETPDDTGTQDHDIHGPNHHPASTLAEAVREHHLREDLEGSVILRPVVAGALPRPWPAVAPRLAVALDLLESRDPRARQVGRDLLAELQDAWQSR